MAISYRASVFTLALFSFAAACDLQQQNSAGTTGSSSGEVGTLREGLTSGGTCASPLEAVDVSNPTTVVGSGPGTCTEAAFAAAVAQGGIITFNCGGPATIRLTSQKQLRADRDTVIDGGGMITLDGGNSTRLLFFDGGDFLTTRTTVTLQRLTLVNGRSTGTPIAPAPPPCSQGFELDGGGAAIFLRDGILHVIDCTFSNNNAASPGPDVGGGAVYVMGSVDATIAGSRFTGNSGSNGGGVGSLFSYLKLANNSFSNNRATGSGENYVWDACAPHEAGGIGQAGSGGNGGAVSMDGSEDWTVTVCGNQFAGNSAGGTGGALFRTANRDYQSTIIDQSTFDRNTANTGGAMFIHHANLTITNTTISNNSALVGGGIKSDDTTFNFINVTLAGNRATQGLGGAIFLAGNGGTLLNCTIAGNRAEGGLGYYASAIAGGTRLTFNNTIFADNLAFDPYTPMACDNTGSGSTNVQWPPNNTAGGSADAPCADGIQFVSAVLTPLADHGGATLSMATVAPAAVVQVGTGCPATDQTGRPRAQPCTIGAVER